MTAALAEAARFELAQRERHWPNKVAAGGMTEAEADADLAAWRAIAALFEHGEAPTSLAWADLVEAAAQAVDSRLAKAAEAGAPDHPKHAQRAAFEVRLGAVFAIRRHLIAAAHARGALAFRHERVAA